MRTTPCFTMCRPQSNDLCNWLCLPAGGPGVYPEVADYQKLDTVNTGSSSAAPLAGPVSNTATKPGHSKKPSFDTFPTDMAYPSDLPPKALSTEVNLTDMPLAVLPFVYSLDEILSLSHQWPHA